MKDWIMGLCPEIAEWQAELIEEQMLSVLSAEREACAKVCEQRSVDGSCYIEGSAEADGCAAAIRARSNP